MSHTCKQSSEKDTWISYLMRRSVRGVGGSIWEKEDISSENGKDKLKHTHKKKQ